MPASVLPNLPVPDSAGAKADPARPVSTPKTGDSEFDAVSRRQQERLERDREADHRAKVDARARTDERPANVSGDRSEKSDKVAGANEVRDRSGDVQDDDARTDKADATTGTETAANEQNDNEEHQKDGVPGFTFAELQALVDTTTSGGPAKSMTTGAGQLAAPQPLEIGGPASAALPTGSGGVSTLLGSLVPGKGSGAVIDAGKSSLKTAALIDGLVGQMAADGDKLTDLTQSLGGRFQGTLDQLHQPVNLPAQAKPTDGAMALRSYATSIDLPVGHAQWGDQLVGKLAWLTARNMQSAQIHLTPPDLGPMEVKIHMHNDQASVTVHSASPVVRDQLDVNSHRLRDLLSANGLSLASFDVSDSPSQSSHGQGGGPGGDSGSGFSPSAGNISDDAEMNIGTLDLAWRGEVDLYA